MRPRTTASPPSPQSAGDAASRSSPPRSVGRTSTAAAGTLAGSAHHRTWDSPNRSPPADPGSPADPGWPADAGSPADALALWRPGTLALWRPELWRPGIVGPPVGSVISTGEACARPASSSLRCGRPRAGGRHAGHDRRRRPPSGGGRRGGAVRRRSPHLVRHLAADLRRSSRPDRGDAADAGRRETLDSGSAGSCTPSTTACCYRAPRPSSSRSTSAGCSTGPEGAWSPARCSCFPA